MTPDEVKILISLLRDDPVAVCLLYEDELVEALEMLLEFIDVQSRP